MALDDDWTLMGPPSQSGIPTSEWSAVINSVGKQNTKRFQEKKVNKIYRPTCVCVCVRPRPYVLTFTIVAYLQLVR